MSDAAIEDQVSLLSTKSVRPSPDTLASKSISSPPRTVIYQLVSELIKRIRALTLKLLPVEVESEIITDPTSRVITPAVIAAYIQAAGDFGEAVSSTNCSWLANTD
jgi:hypothetical protein